MWLNHRAMGLTNTGVLKILPDISEGLSPDKHLTALDLFEEYADLLSTGPIIYSCLKEHETRLT